MSLLLPNLLDKFIPRCIALRQLLHRNPELSSEECRTAEAVAEWFEPLSPDETILRLGGHGLAFVFKGKKPGETLLFRCELDALPIQETTCAPYEPKTCGVSHACGHDGHMAILAAVGAALSERRPSSGSVILLFQPAEETGQGASRVLADDRFASIRPDIVLALHNMPHQPLGSVLLRDGTFHCASAGMRIELLGKTSHAAYPEHGLSPASVVAEILKRLPSLPAALDTGAFALATITHSCIGEPSFGVAPGHALVQAVLRAETDDALDRLTEEAETTVRKIARNTGLECDIRWRERFRADVSRPEINDIVRRAAVSLGLETAELREPMRYSEDFSEFTSRFPGAAVALGAGETHPQLHNPDYDFPDDLLPIGTALCLSVVEHILR